MTHQSSKIELRISNSHAYVWDVNDIRRLRSEYHICGVLAGTLPHLAQQNVFLGVPLLLMPEEVVFLVENGSAVLVDDCEAHKEPSQEEKAEWNTKRKLVEMQSSVQREGSKGSVAASKGSTEEAIRKRHERQEKRAAAMTKASTTGDLDLSNLTTVSVAQTPPRSTSPASTTISTNIYSVVIPTTSAPLAWYRPTESSYSSLDEAREAGLWSYPSTAEERARCAVFRHLWEKGYYMGCGIKFGGEFLVYPGDPLRYHSHFTASVFSSHSTPIRPMEFVAHGRLGTATKKAHLLCTWDEVTKNVDVYSLEWSGFG